MTRSDIVAWLIESKPGELSATEAMSAGSAHFDESRFLQDVMKELKAQKARGEDVSLDSLLKCARGGRERTTKARPAERTALDAPSRGDMSSSPAD